MTTRHVGLWLAIAAIAGSAPATAGAQAASNAPSAPATAAELNALEERTMEVVASGSTNIGSQILGSSRMMAGRGAELTILDGQMAAALPIYGRVIGWERAGERRVGSYLVLRRYIVRHENMLTVWYLTYMNPSGGWQVAGINFNDQIQNLSGDW